MVLTAVLSIQSAQAQESKEEWPGVTIKVLTENEYVKVYKVTFAPGAVADWHDHPNYTLYALTDVKVQEEMKGNEPVTNELKAGQVAYITARHHRTTNLAKTTIEVIVTEIKK